MYKVTVPTIITNGHFNKEKTLDELKRCGAERVALALDRELEYSFSSPENLKLLKELVKYYHDNGFEVLVWLGETFGHSGVKQNDKGKYTGMRTVDGDTITVFCPLDENFKTDFCKWIKDVAKCEPDMIMLDDDFRLGFREGYLGCCCDNHMQRINKKIDEEIEVDNLKNLLFDGGKNKYRDVWLEVQKEAMEEFAYTLRNSLNEVNPDIRLGFCAAPCSWDSEGWDAAEVAKIMAGDTKPFLRTLGAPYWATWRLYGKTLGEMIETSRSQLGRLPEGEVFCEGDTYPRPRTACPAAYLECFDMIMRADGRADGILKYMLDYVSDADYETGYIDAMIRNKELYKKIDDLFAGGKCTGVRPYNAKITANAVYDITRPNLLNEIQDSLFNKAFEFTTDNLLPVTYEKGYVNIVFGEHARHITVEELKNGSIIDITAAEILANRGIDVGVKSFLQPESYKQKGFSDLPQEYHIEEDIYTRLDIGTNPKSVIKKESTRLISKYIYKDKVIDGDFEYENAEGMRFRVFSFDAFEASRRKGWLSSYAKRRSIVKSIQWLGKGLEVYPDGNYPELYVMTKKKDSSLSIGMWNLFADKIENLRLNINIKYKNVHFINCKGHAEKNSVVLDDILYPYEFAGVEIIL